MKNQNDVDIYKEYYMPSRLRSVSDEKNLQIEKMWCEIIAGDDSQIYDFYKIHTPVMNHIVGRIALTESKLLVNCGVTIKDLRQELYIFIYKFIEDQRRHRDRLKTWKNTPIHFIIMRELRTYLFRKVLHLNHKIGYGDVLNEYPCSLDTPSPFEGNDDDADNATINYISYKNSDVFKTPDYSVLMKEKHSVITNKINELPDDLKEFLFLYYFKKKTRKDICKIFRFSEWKFARQSEKILEFFRSDKEFTDYFDELKIKGFGIKMRFTRGGAVAVRSDAENEAFVSDVCRTLLDNNGDIKATLSTLKSKYSYIKYSQVNAIKNKVNYVSISDKFFPKNYFAEYDRLRRTTKYDLYDKDMKLIKHFDKIKDVSAYLHSAEETVRKYAKANALFRNMYYIRECE